MAGHVVTPRATVAAGLSTSGHISAAPRSAHGTPFRRRPKGQSTSNQCAYHQPHEAMFQRASSSRSEAPATATVEETAAAELVVEDEDVSDVVAEEAAAEPDVGRSRKQLWKAAVKLPMYSVALVPLMVGTAVAFSVAGVFSCSQFFGVLLASVLIIAWLNLSNDAFDADTGVDTSKAESVVNLLGGRKGLVLCLANGALAFGVWLMAISMGSVTDGRVFGWLAAAVACGYVYQGPPFRLSYKGLGEPLCFVAFGPLATGAFFLAQMSAAGVTTTIPWMLWVCATVVGLTTTAILFCSHFHQIEGDRAAGKMSPLVRLGSLRAAGMLQFGVWGAYGLLAAGTMVGVVPVVASAACLMSFPAARNLVNYVNLHHSTPAKIMTSKLTAINWHIALGFSLCIGLIIARLQPGIASMIL